MKPIIEAAIQSGLPPLALLMDDPDRRGYSKWDMKLIKAFYINQAFEIDGHPIHIEESPDIIWRAQRRKLRSAEVVEAEQDRMSNSKAKNHGVRIVAVPELKPGAKWPTRAGWRDRLAGKVEESDAGAAKIAAAAKAEDEKARLKLVEMGLA